MKAVVYTEYGPPEVLHLTVVAKPAPKDNQVLVKIHATTVNFGDTLARNFKAVSPRDFTMPAVFWLPTRLTFGFNKPKINILGSEFAGEVEAVGQAVTAFKPGDAVFGYRGAAMGANTEYLCVAENSLLAHKPANMSFAEAAAVPYGAITALHLLRKVSIQPGQKVLINGASGSIGSYALQLARYYGAEVTGVCGTPRLDYVRALGADKVIDYTQEDFSSGTERYDLVIDIMNKSSFARVKRVLKQNGTYLLASFKMKQLVQMLWTSITGGKRVICALSSEKPEDLRYIKDLVEAGAIKAIIDRCYPLEETAEAHRYVENGHKQGQIVLTVVN